MTSPIVLVHGAWHGGWCWDKVRPLLEAAGHRVLAPTLTGLEVSEQLCTPVPSLATHIADIVNLVEAEDLHDLVLVGHSYGGIVITGAVDALRGRVRHLVYLDAAVPADGENLASFVPGISAEEVRRRESAFRAMAPDATWLPPLPPTMVGVTDPRDTQWLQRRMRPHPLRTWLDPISLRHGGHAGIPKTYVLAADPPTDAMGYPRLAQALRADSEWACQEIPCGHDMMVVEPARTAAFIAEAAA
jgi:pimeloyl-ACP methyl ester carboxylesterase